MFKWSKENIKWFLRAEEATEFYDRVVKNIGRYLQDTESALDIGCGIGPIALRLAVKKVRVSALDTSELALRTVDKRLEGRGFENVITIKQDFEKFYTEEKYDMVIGSYIMGLVNENNINRLLNLAKKYIILVLPIKEYKNDFSINELLLKIDGDTATLKQKTYVDICELLQRKNINHNISFIHTQFNQPLNSLEEGLEFIKFYFNISQDYEVEVMDWLKEKVKSDERGLFLPSYRESAIIIIYRGSGKNVT